MAKAPYGSWKSPISTDLIVAGSIGLSSPHALQNGRCWIESRPQEGGRSVLVQQSPDGEVRDITPAPFNIRTRVHEYGGGASLIHGDSIYFSNFADQQLYCQGWEDPAPTQLTHAEGFRFANGCVDTRRNRMIYVVEDHNVSGEPQNLIGAVDLKTGELKILAKGQDFYSSPVISPD